jgi:hypothetical protein
MSNTPDNPPAFPLSAGPEYLGKEGMTLLDYFAGQSMAGYRASETDPDASYMSPNRLADLAYDDAESMLAERQRRLAE